MLFSLPLTLDILDNSLLQDEEDEKEDDDISQKYKQEEPKPQNAEPKVEKIVEPDIAPILRKAFSNSSQNSEKGGLTNIRKKSTNSSKDADYKEYKVSDPVMGSHVTYTVRGVDNDGKFEVTRRYNDFNNLRNSLLARWPGIYFPPIPPKKKVGNKDSSFVEERRYFLQRFLSKLALQDFILSSEEFKIFTRTTGDTEKYFNQLPQLNLDMILDRLRNTFGIDENPPHELIIS